MKANIDIYIMITDREKMSRDRPKIVRVMLNVARDEVRGQIMLHQSLTDLFDRREKYGH